MSWKDLLQDNEETVVSPWVGGGTVHSSTRSWKISGTFPREFGWYRWSVSGRKVHSPVEADPDPEILSNLVRGYLVGDRIVLDTARVDPDPKKIVNFSEKVYLLEPGLDRFVRIQAGRVYPEGPLIYVGMEFPLGPEDDVLEAYLDRAVSVSDISEVVPALDAAFRMETYQRELAEERRRELERRRREEEERRAKEERRQALIKRLGDGEGRRAMAKENFAEAARAALQVGGAVYLDHRASLQRGEWAVRYRVDGQRLECVVNTNLQIIDAGVCLVDHETGIKGDTWLTLESLPSTVREAMQTNQLVIFRHA